MNELLSKQGKCIMHLAHHLLATTPQDRLPSMQQIATEQQVSVGTVQAAMQYLQYENIITVENRGRLGAYVKYLDYSRLWALAYRRTMTAILPMPYSRHLEGLATGLRACFDDHEFDVALRFMRGATARIQRLHAQQCDWVVTSLYAVDAARVQGFDVEVIASLGLGTYTRDHVLVLNGNRTLQSGMRVGIDVDSADHAYVVRQLSRGIRVTLVEIDYTTGLDKLLLGEIDATVWTEHDLPVLPKHIFVHPVESDDFEAGPLRLLGEAVVVGVRGATEVANVLHDTLHPAKIFDTQRAVVSGERKASY